MKLLPSLKQLEYLVALADLEHFGKAAERCNITPSTLSVGIRELENILEVPLAERTKRSVRMTPIGAQIASRAQALLRDADDIMELAQSNRKFMSGDIRLGVIPTISPFLLPRVLPTLNAKYPDLSLYLREDKSEPLLEGLRAGEIDVALIALPYDVEDLVSEVVLTDQFEFACRRYHKFANKKKITAADLSQEPLMLLEEGHCLRGHALDACQLAAGPRQAQLEATSLHTLVQMVASGIGVTLLPKLAIDAKITRGSGIKLIPLSFSATREIGLVWRKSSMRAEEFKALGELFGRV